jgi:hypothetical protein
MEYTEQQKQIYNDVCDKYKHNWLNTTISQTMAMEMISKALNIHNVSQQRELLVAFAEWILISEEDITSEMINKDVNTFLATNCG